MTCVPVIPAFEYYAKAIEAIELGEFDQAIEYISRQIREDPGDRDALDLRAQLHHQLGFEALAIADYTQAIDLGLEDYQTYLSRGQLYSQNSGNFEKALSDFKSAQDLQPQNPQAYQSAFVIYERQKNFPAALRSITQAILSAPECALYQTQRGLLLFHRLGNLTSAAKDFEQVVERCNTDAQARLDYGMVLACLNKRSKALKMFRQAIGLSTDCQVSVDAYLKISLMLEAQKKFSSAQCYLESALRSGLMDCRIYRQIGSIAEAQGNLDTAIDAYSQSLKLERCFQSLENRSPCA